MNMSMQETSLSVYNNGQKLIQKNRSIFQVENYFSKVPHPIKEYSTLKSVFKF